ncbi:MAG: hypothetical protein K2Y37_04885 [Pirellulales bacterium]|nr:hypothetical protein [Pirellulales bacterium]
MLPILLVVVMIAIFAALMRDGLWSNLLMLVNVVTAGLVAMTFFEPVANLLTKQLPSGTMFWDLVALWGLFAATLGALRAITDQVSRIRVRFKPPVEMVGGYLLALAVAYVGMAFAATTLHTAPLARNFLWGGFRPEDPLLFGLKPDRQWLAFVQMVSRGSLARLTEEGKEEQYVFDPKAEFMPKYASRRSKYELTPTFTGLGS